MFQGQYHTNSSGTHSVAGSRGLGGAPEHIYNNDANRAMNDYDNHSREYLLVRRIVFIA